MTGFFFARKDVFMRKSVLLILFMIITKSVAQPDGYDFGLLVEKNLEANTNVLFGIRKPLLQTIDKSIDRSSTKTADDIVLLAEGLQVEFLTREAADYADMFAFWPDDINPTHLIFCIEGRREEISTGKWNPSVQRIDINTGNVETIVRGMNGCDGIRRTPWGSILATEESSDGHAFELIEPLAVTNITVLDRNSGKVTEPSHFSRRDALPTMAWEGLTVLDSGVVIAGDEWRPGSSAPGANGGSIYKFIPQDTAGMNKISTLNESPLVSGKVYALRVDCQPESHRSFPQYGQGCEVGNATWVNVSAANARRDANQIKATGYYRPEDLHSDPFYKGEGIRFCWTNTGNKKADHYGEVMCAVDSQPLTADIKRASVNVQRFIEGDPQFNSVDNLAFQPITGNLYVLEDDKHGEIYACLPDGQDRDQKSDGCIRVLAVVDPSAEPTGLAFSADGKTAYLSIQHSKDHGMPLVDDYPTDDILRITGFQMSIPQPSKP